MQLVRTHQRAIHAVLVTGYVTLLSGACWVFTHLH